MTHALKRLLGNDHPLFSANITELERAAGGDGIDTRLIADIIEKTHKVLRDIGLDPADSHPSEVYYALNSLVRSQRAEEVLHDASFGLVDFDGEVVSFNLQDVIENAHHELPYEDRTLAHGLRHLRIEVVRRYADHERTDTEFVHRLAEQIGLKQEHDELHPVVVHPTSSDAPRILAIGDIFTDAFIKLHDDEAKVIKDDDGKEWLSVQFGAKMPYEQVDIVQSVGPSPNASVSFSRLGLRAGLMAFLGDDEVGKQSISYLNEQGIDTSTMVAEEGAKSSYWYVLRYGADRTMLVKNEDYKYEWREPSYVPDWVYLSQISPNAWDLHEKLLTYLDKHPETKLAFQPGTSHFRWGVDKLRAIYARAHIVVMNREEAMDVTGRPHESIRELANGLHELGPHVVVITDGPKGSYASYDFKLVTIPNYPDPAPPFERTGAGDAFASTIVAALALGEPMDTALTWAPINSMNVVQHLGAQEGLLKLDKIKHHLSKAPENYKLTEVEE